VILYTVLLPVILRPSYIMVEGLQVVFFRLHVTSLMAQA